jgi:hypothetical protein
MRPSTWRASTPARRRCRSRQARGDPARYWREAPARGSPPVPRSMSLGVVVELQHLRLSRRELIVRQHTGPMKLRQLPHLGDRVTPGGRDTVFRRVRLTVLLVVRILRLSTPGERLRHPGLSRAKEEKHASLRRTPDHSSTGSARAESWRLNRWRGSPLDLRLHGPTRVTGACPGRPRDAPYVCVPVDKHTD